MDYFNYFVGVNKITGEKSAGYLPTGVTVDIGDEAIMQNGSRFKVLAVADWCASDTAVPKLLKDTFGALNKPMRLYRAIDINWEPEDVVNE